MEKGLIHVYTGDGKGKTTAAMGLALRAYGTGRKVCILQFLKTAPSGEVELIKRLDSGRIAVHRFETPHGFFYDPDAPETKALRGDTLAALDFVKTAFLQDDCRFYVLDEVICAYNLKLITREELCTVLECKPADCELVLTGRGAPDWLIARADYVTNMTLIKHPFDQGVGAREGIEF